jgi:GNAT superfamily N-acetyltransferase
MTSARLASADDRDTAVGLVRALLIELGGNPPSAVDLFSIFDRLVTDIDAGFIVVGESASGIVSVCTVSFLDAIRTRGRYAIIQEMFVEPEWRSTGVGMEVLRFALNHAVANGCQTVELGTPFHGDRQIQFYRRAGFTEVGARLRWRADP